MQFFGSAQSLHICGRDLGACHRSESIWSLAVDGLQVAGLRLWANIYLTWLAFWTHPAVALSRMPQHKDPAA